MEGEIFFLAEKIRIMYVEGLYFLELVTEYWKLQRNLIVELPQPGKNQVSLLRCLARYDELCAWILKHDEYFGPKNNRRKY
jgi:hypothetical protein